MIRRVLPNLNQGDYSFDVPLKWHSTLRVDVEQLLRLHFPLVVVSAFLSKITTRRLSLRRRYL